MNKTEPCEFCEDGLMHVLAQDGEIVVPCPYCSTGTRILHSRSKAAGVPYAESLLADINRLQKDMSTGVLSAMFSMFSAARDFDGRSRKNMIVQAVPSHWRRSVLSAMANEHLRRGRDVLCVHTEELSRHETDELLAVPILFISEFLTEHVHSNKIMDSIDEFLRRRLKSTNFTLISTDMNFENISTALKPSAGEPLETFMGFHHVNEPPPPKSKFQLRMEDAI